LKKVVPDYRVSPPVTHSKSPLNSGGSIEERGEPLNQAVCPSSEESFILVLIPFFSCGFTSRLIWSCFVSAAAGNEADHEVAAKEESNPFSTSGDFSESGKSPDKIGPANWRPLLRRGSSLRSTYSGGSELEGIDFG
jgi:hypothetical protein